MNSTFSNKKLSNTSHKNSTSPLTPGNKQKTTNPAPNQDRTHPAQNKTNQGNPNQCRKENVQKKT